jgi:uncharacterized protein YbjT (DUF2867 family)
VTHAIVGATGNTGRRVVGAFAQRGLQMRAVVRSEDGARRARELGIGDHAIADLRDVDALARALDGARAVHVVPPLFDPHEDALVANAVTAAEHDRAGAGDALTVPYDLASRFAVIDVEDIAEVSAIVASQDGHAYAAYELAGPDVLTMAQLAEQLGAALGRPLEARLIAPCELSLPPSWSRSAIADIMAMWADYDEHGLVGNPRVAEMLLGRPPTTFAEAMARDLQAAGSPAAAAPSLT